MGLLLESMLCPGDLYRPHVSDDLVGFSLIFSLISNSVKFMLTQILIGNIGADAICQQKDGREFTTFRVAHNDSWKDDAGQVHEHVTWVDCIMSGRPNVLPFLKRGTQVAVIGTVTLRVYSSAKDRCMKAGMTINVQRIELLGGKADAVPSRLFDSSGVQVDVVKCFWTDQKSCTLQDDHGKLYDVDANGFALPQVTNNESAAQTNETAQ